MQNQENKIVPNLSDFVPNLLKQLQFIEPKRLLEIKAFFSEAFLLHTEDEVFNTSDYRVQWLNNINYLADLSMNISNFTPEQLDEAIDQALVLLEKGKEAKNG